MTPDVGSPLRQRMIEDMVARKLARGTQRGDIFACKQLAAYLGRSPEAATPDDVRSFQRHLIDSGRSVHYRNRIMTGVKFLLKVTMRRHDLVAEIYHLREPQAVAVVLAPEEVIKLLAVRAEPQGARHAHHRLRLRVARRRGDAAQGARYRQRTGHHPRRAGQGAEGPQCHAAARGAGAVAAMVVRAPEALRPWPCAG
jgi:integrase-like protein